MKKYLAFILLLLLAACHFRTDRKQLAAIGKLPDFRIISVDSCTCIDTKKIPPGSPLVFIYFDPDCEHCQTETKGILSHLDHLRNARFYFVTNGGDKELKKFCQTFRLDTVKNIMVGKDYEYSFYKVYLPPTVPFMAIYNRRKNLVKIYIGETNVNSIISSTQE